VRGHCFGQIRTVTSDGPAEEIVLTPVRDEEIDSTRNSEKRIQRIGLLVVLSLLSLSGGLVWWALS